MRKSILAGLVGVASSIALGAGLAKGFCSEVCPLA